MTRFRRVAAVLVTLGTLLSVSACGTSVPAAVGTYKATFVTTPKPGVASAFIANPDEEFSLVLNGDGHFVMKFLGPGVTFKGTWSQFKDQITLSEVNRLTKIKFVAVQKGRSLREGHIEYLSRPGPVGYTLTWSAVRT